jgi:hypothetical protein
MTKRKLNKQAKDNVGTALCALQAARSILFYEMGSQASARRNPRIRETEWAICDASKSLASIAA